MMRLLLLCVLSLTAGTPPVQAQPTKPPTPKDGPLGMKFVPLPKGTTYLGWNGTKGSAKKTEIKDDFEIAIHTVTQGQWAELMGNNPSWHQRFNVRKDKVRDIAEEDLKQFPVENVSWHEAQAFIKKLNEREKGKSFRYRLPSEVEWEYACRGGATTEQECSFFYYLQKPTNDLSSTQANFDGSEPFGKGEKGPYLGRVTKVGSYPSNKLGIYDMHGNVQQWCEDQWGPPQGDLVFRAVRGGCYFMPGRDCTASYSFRGLDFRSGGDCGFRLVRVAFKEPPAKAEPKEQDAGKADTIPFTIEFNPAKDIAILDRPAGKDGLFVRVRFTVATKDSHAVGDVKLYEIRCYEDGRPATTAAVQKINAPSEIVFKSTLQKQDGQARTIELRLVRVSTVVESTETVGAGKNAKPPVSKDGPLGMKFVPLPKGTTYLGWNGKPGSANKTEIREDFEIAIHTVTQGQWQELMGNNPSYFSRDGKGKDKVKDIKDDDLQQFPVEQVTWNDCQEFIKKLNEKEKGKGWLYRLPSEAEWEYACRGGATTEEECSYHFYFDKPTNDLSSTQANFSGQFPFGKGEKGPDLLRTTKVGSYAPNKLGLYDMHGNVWQWCSDLDDPKAASFRVTRGGCWYDYGKYCQAAFRTSANTPSNRFGSLGLRLARVAVKEPPAKEPAKPAPEAPKPKDGPLGMKFVPLPKGTTYLGWNGERGSAKKTEIREDFEIAIYTVTQGQWTELMGKNPSWYSRDGRGKDKVKDIKDEELKQFPVERVSWDDCQEFLKKLNEKERGRGWLYRLPSEEEWEYACRGGATSEDECSYRFYFDKPTNDLSSKQTNFRGITMKGEMGPYLGRPTKVGSYQPNKLGLYDMHGNVMQWTYSDGLNFPDRGPTYRGGGWSDSAYQCQAASRGRKVPSARDSGMGFRLARVSVKEPPAKEPPAKSVPKNGPLGMKFVPLPKGTTYLGWNGTKGSAKKTEIREDFEIAIHTVTQGQWQELMGNNPSYFKRGGGGKDRVKDIKDEDLKQFPVESVSWDDAQEFIKKLNEKELGKGYVYRLPTSVEWEYACRGGATTEEECSYHFYFARPTNDLSWNQANFHSDDPGGKGAKGPWLQRTTRVGSYAPNKLGLYDMHGNVSHWCEDLVDVKLPDRKLVGRGTRGGGWWTFGVLCTASYSGWNYPSDRFIGRGFRLVRVAAKEPPLKAVPQAP